MLNGGGGAESGSATVRLRNSMLEQLDAVDVDSLAPEELGAGLKFMRATVDLLELQVARWLAAFDSRQAFYDLGEHSTVRSVLTPTSPAPAPTARSRWPGSWRLWSPPSRLCSRATSPSSMRC